MSNKESYFLYSKKFVSVIIFVKELVVLETMSLFEFFTVAIPELIILNMITLLIYRKNKKYSIAQYLIRLSITIGYLSICIFFIRQNIKDLMISGMIYLVLLTLNYRVIWNYNFRQSLLLSFTCIFVIDIAEGITTPVINILLEKLNIANMFDNIFAITIPSRIFEIILIIFIYYSETSFNSVIFDEKLEKLKKSDIFILLVIFIILFVCFISNSNNMNLYIKLEELKINMFIIEKYLKINLVIPLLYILATLLLLLKMKKYYIFRSIALKTPEEIITDIARVSSSEQIKNYHNILNSNQ